MLTRKESSWKIFPSATSQRQRDQRLVDQRPKESLHVEASSRKPHQINWCEFVNRADGISEIEGKGRRGDRASRTGSEFQIRVSKASPKKFLVPMSTLIAVLRFTAMKGKPQNQKERNKNEFTDSPQKNTNPATSHCTGARRAHVA